MEKRTKGVKYKLQEAWTEKKLHLLNGSEKVGFLYSVGIKNRQYSNLKVEIENVNKRLLTKFHFVRCVKT